MIKKLFLLAIFILALFLRIYRLEDFPVGLHIDEAQVGYNAYSLLKTGRDEFGNFLPHHLSIFDSDRPTGLFYLAIPSIALLGLNEFATRLPTAILGTAIVIVFYFFINLLFANKVLAVVGVLLLSISPWHIIFSRAGIENILELLNVLIGASLLFHGLRKKKTLSFLLSYFFFLFAYFSYMASRIFVPLLLIGFGIVFFKDLGRRKMLKPFLFVSILYFIVPFSLFLFKSEATSRFKQIGLFTHPEVQLQLEEQIREDGGFHPLATRFFHNKLLNYSLKLFENYQEYFTGKFLFTFGGFPMRFRVPQTGVLYFFELPFLFLGLFYFSKKRKKEQMFILYWFLIGPIPASLTVEDVPNFQRAILMLPAIEVVIATGILQTVNFFQKLGFLKLGILGIVFCYLYGFAFFLHQYFHHQKVHRTWYRAYEMKELVKEVAQRENYYDKIVMTKDTTEPYIFFLFYNKIEPAYYQKKAANLNWKGNWQLDKYIFDGRDCPLLDEEKPIENRLYVERSKCELEPWIKVIYEIKRPDGSIALRLEEFDKSKFTPSLEIRRE